MFIVEERNDEKYAICHLVSASRVSLDLPGAFSIMRIPELKSQAKRACITPGFESTWRKINLLPDWFLVHEPEELGHLLSPAEGMGIDFESELCWVAEEYKMGLKE
jgi:hypothetical protein